MCHIVFLYQLTVLSYKKGHKMVLLAYLVQGNDISHNLWLFHP